MTAPVYLVTWPSSVATHAEIWRVLDLCGLTKSVRESRNFLKAGFVYLDNTPVSTLIDRVELGKNFRLELRFPNGVTSGKNLRLVRPVRYKARINQPDTRYHKA